MSQLIRDWFNIYTWKEYWMAVAIACCFALAMVYVTIAICFMSQIVTCVMVYGFIVVSSLLVAHYNPKSRC